MAGLSFTGADLRDWHAAHCAPATHAVVDEALRGTPLLSWEDAASKLRGVLRDPAKAADEVPDQVRALLGLYLDGVVMGRKSLEAERTALREVA